MVKSFVNEYNLPLFRSSKLDEKLTKNLLQKTTVKTSLRKD